MLKKLKEAGLTVNRKKCEFGCSQVKYSGYVLDREGLRPDAEKIVPVVNYPPSVNLKQLRRFLEMVGWYACFIPDESDIKVPLLKLTRKDEEWSWGKEQQKAFEKLKEALVTAPVLARHDFSKPFIIQTDASATAIGGVLIQINVEEEEHPIVYFSRVLITAERNYTTTKRELLGLIHGIKKMRTYLEGYKFVAVTDHIALKYLRNLKEPTGRLARWALELQQSDFEIVH